MHIVPAKLVETHKWGNRETRIGGEARKPPGGGTRHLFGTDGQRFIWRWCPPKKGRSLINNFLLKELFDSSSCYLNNITKEKRYKYKEKKKC